ncbi:hypothetical protein NQZ68_005701 [Dissostichus eleginoides]|nr:hypothetical protein NQZ68_005701 [Dissostichus eleginoides]
MEIHWSDADSSFSPGSQEGAVPTANLNEKQQGRCRAPHDGPALVIRRRRPVALDVNKSKVL